MEGALNSSHSADGIPLESHAWQTGHDVEFYSTDAALVPTVVDFLASGVRAGQPIVVIATAAHRQQFAAGLLAEGIDIDDLMEGRDRVWLDADETLTSFMDGDSPNPEMFAATIGRVFARLKKDRQYLVVRAYGEMVDILWQAGRATAALEVERLWNALATEHSFWLLCAYSEASLEKECGEAQLGQICGHHRRIVAREPAVRARFSQPLQLRIEQAG
jgi:hypothetical protein